MAITAIMEKLSPPLKIFISCTGDDLELAGKIYDALSNTGESPFLYTRDIDYGGRFPEQIREEIEQADCILVVLSSSLLDTSRSSWPAREVQFALSLQHERSTAQQNRYPALIGLASPDALKSILKDGIFTLQLHDFATGVLLPGLKYDFLKQNLIPWDREQADELSRRLLTVFDQKVTHFRSRADMNRDANLFEAAMDLYEELIPDPCERDPRDFIREWICDTCGTRNDWLDWFAVNHHRGWVTGGFWCNIDLRTGLAHVPFWGMRAGCRGELQSVSLVGNALAAMQKDLEARGVSLKAVVFEAEPVDLPYFEELVRRAAARAGHTQIHAITKCLLRSVKVVAPGESFSPLQQEMIATAAAEPRDDEGNFPLRDQIRRFRRLALYSGKGGYSKELRNYGWEVQGFVRSGHAKPEVDSEFVIYMQPPIVPPEDAEATSVSDSDKRPLLLFMLTPKGCTFSAETIVDWEYDVFLGDQYSERGGDSRLPDWEHYMIDFKQRFRGEFIRAARLKSPCLGESYDAAEAILAVARKWSHLPTDQHPVPDLDITL